MTSPLVCPELWLQLLHHWSGRHAGVVNGLNAQMRSVSAAATQRVVVEAALFGRAGVQLQMPCKVPCQFLLLQGFPPATALIHPLPRCAGNPLCSHLATFDKAKKSRLPQSVETGCGLTAAAALNK